MKTHEHVKCPRCHVALGRNDTICWACRHIVKAPGIYIKHVWLLISLKVGAAVAAVVFLLKYKEQVAAFLQAVLRSILKH